MVLKKVNLVLTGAFGWVELAKDVELVQSRDDHEDEVPNEEHDAKLAIQSPAVEVGGNDEKSDGGKQTEGGVDQALALDQDMAAGADDGRLQEPGQAQTDQDVKDVAADGIGDGHVAMALLDHGNAAQGIGDTDSGSDEGQTHDGVGNGEGEADHCDHPDHEVGVQRDPSHRHAKGGHEETSHLRFATV